MQGVNRCRRESPATGSLACGDRGASAPPETMVGDTAAHSADGSLPAPSMPLQGALAASATVLAARAVGPLATDTHALEKAIRLYSSAEYMAAHCAWTARVHKRLDFAKRNLAFQDLYVHWVVTNALTRATEGMPLACTVRRMLVSLAETPLPMPFAPSPPHTTAAPTDGSGTGNRGEVAPRVSSFDEMCKSMGIDNLRCIGRGIKTALMWDFFCTDLFRGRDGGDSLESRKDQAHASTMSPAAFRCFARWLTAALPCGPSSASGIDMTRTQVRAWMRAPEQETFRQNCISVWLRAKALCAVYTRECPDAARVKREHIELAMTHFERRHRHGGTTDASWAQDVGADIAPAAGIPPPPPSPPAPLRQLLPAAAPVCKNAVVGAQPWFKQPTTTDIATLVLGSIEQSARAALALGGYAAMAAVQRRYARHRAIPPAMASTPCPSSRKRKAPSIDPIPAMTSDGETEYIDIGDYPPDAVCTLFATPSAKRPAAARVEGVPRPAHSPTDARDNLVVHTPAAAAADPFSCRDLQYKRVVGAKPNLSVCFVPTERDGDPRRHPDLTAFDSIEPRCSHCIAHDTGAARTGIDVAEIRRYTTDLYTTGMRQSMQSAALATLPLLIHCGAVGCAASTSLPSPMADADDASGTDPAVATTVYLQEQIVEAIGAFTHSCALGPQPLRDGDACEKEWWFDSLFASPPDERAQNEHAAADGTTPDGTSPFERAQCLLDRVKRCVEYVDTIANTDDPTPLLFAHSRPNDAGASETATPQETTCRCLLARRRPMCIKRLVDTMAQALALLTSPDAARALATVWATPGTRAHFALV